MLVADSILHSQGKYEHMNSGEGGAASDDSGGRMLKAAHVSSAGLSMQVHSWRNECWVRNCRRGIEGVNDALLTRGFAMNEEGGILKASHHYHLLQSCIRRNQQRVRFWLDSCKSLAPWLRESKRSGGSRRSREPKGPGDQGGAGIFRCQGIVGRWGGGGQEIKGVRRHRLAVGQPRAVLHQHQQSLLLLILQAGMLSG